MQKGDGLENQEDMIASMIASQKHEQPCTHVHDCCSQGVSESAVNWLIPWIQGRCCASTTETHRLAAITAFTQYCHARRTVKGVDAYLLLLCCA